MLCFIIFLLLFVFVCCLFFHVFKVLHDYCHQQKTFLSNVIRLVVVRLKNGFLTSGHQLWVASSVCQITYFKFCNRLRGTEWSSNKLVVLKLMNEMILFYYCFLQFRVKRIPFFLLIFVTVIRYHRSAGEIYQPRCN